MGVFTEYFMYVSWFCQPVSNFRVNVTFLWDSIILTIVQTLPSFVSFGLHGSLSLESEASYLSTIYSLNVTART